MCDSLGMSQTVSIILSAEDRERLAAIIGDRNRRQKHVQRARIIFHSDRESSVTAVSRLAEASRPAVWRWQQRFPALRFIVGMIAIKWMARKLWKINRPGRRASGIVFLMIFASALLTLLWMCRSCRLVNWLCASQTQKTILSQRLPSIACSNPLI